MANAVTTFQWGAVSTNVRDDATDALLASSGSGVNKIGLRNSRFRLVEGGQEVAIRSENYLDVVIVGATPSISRAYYQGTFDPTKKGEKPTCSSIDGVRPDAASPCKQSAMCQTCPQSVKGSKIVDGKKLVACSYLQRIAVVLHGDPNNKVYQVTVKAKSLFGTGQPGNNLFTLGELKKILGAKNERVGRLIIRMSFDLDETVPKLLFSPIGYLPDDEYVKMIEIGKSPETKACVSGPIDAGVTGSDAERPTPEVVAFEETKPAAPPPQAAQAPKPPPPVVKAATPEDLASKLDDMFDD